MKTIDKVAVITGGASGLGLATAKYLVEEKGTRVAIWDLDEQAGSFLVEQLGSESALFCKADVADEIDVDEAIAQTMRRYGRIDIVINAAAIALSFRILDSDGVASRLQKFRKAIDVNLVGTFCVTSKCVEAMTRNDAENGEKGVVVNTSSIAAYEGVIGTSAYSASKAGINGMNVPLARELQPLGIRINSIAPGFFETPMFRQLPEAAKNRLSGMCEAPKRLGSPEEFAHACVFLIENAYMNGRVLRLDGAAVMYTA